VLFFTSASNGKNEQIVEISMIGVVADGCQGDVHTSGKLARKQEASKKTKNLQNVGSF